jgi:hypothetical protein
MIEVVMNLGHHTSTNETSIPQHFFETDNCMAQKKEKLLKRREDGFDLNAMTQISLKEYSALHDPNMRHYFENPNVQRLLYQTGQIDRHGRVINLEKNKSKLQILEREFRDAERLEERKLKEEMEMRVDRQ